MFPFFLHLPPLKYRLTACFLNFKAKHDLCCRNPAPLLLKILLVRAESTNLSSIVYTVVKEQSQQQQAVSESFVSSAFIQLCVCVSVRVTSWPAGRRRVCVCTIWAVSTHFLCLHSEPTALRFPGSLCHSKETWHLMCLPY